MPTDLIHSEYQKQMKEDFVDAVFNISPYDTPFLTMCKSGSAKNIKVNWQEDVLTAPGVNAALEGADAAYVDETPVAVKSNTCQIFNKTCKVSGTAEDGAEWYGRGSEMAYQLAKKSKEMKRDMEHALVGTKQIEVVTGDQDNNDIIDQARQLGSFQALVSATTTVGYAGIPTTLDEAKLLEGLQLVWDKGGDPTTLLVDGPGSLAVAGFAYSAGRQRDVRNERTLVNVVDLYVSPFGEVDVVLDRWLSDDNMLILDPEYLEFAYLRTPMKIDIAKTGDSDKVQLITEGTFKLLNAESCGMIEDLDN